MSILERVAHHADEPIYSPYGYVIVEDGSVYSLTQKWTHGVILACLYPEEAEADGYPPPDEDFNVFTYQRFELDNHTRFPIVRIALGSLYSFNVSKGDMPATPAQVQSVAKCVRMCDLSLSDTVQTEGSDMSARSMLKELEKGEGDYGPPDDWKPKRPVTRLTPKRNYDDV